MLEVKFKQALESLDYFCEKVCGTKEPICIELPDRKKVVLLAYDEYEKMKKSSE